MASCTDHLTQKPGQQARLTIAQAIFLPSLQLRDLSSLDRYFRYYERELGMLKFGKLGQRLSSTDLAIKTHADVLFVVETLRDSENVTKRQVRDRLRVRFADADELALNGSIYLSLRLWMMVNVREHSLRLQTPQTPVLMWDDDLPFEEFLDRTFPTARWQIGAKDSRLHPSFTAAFMVEICGLHLEWTDCLADHLRLDRRHKILRIYPHKICLRNHLDNVELAATGTVRM